MSIFNAEQFLDVQMDEVNTRRPAIAAGDYPATIEKVDMKSGEKDGRNWLQAVVTMRVSVPADQQSTLGTDTILLTDRSFIDVNEQGLIDNGPGKNRGQRQYRDATGLNVPGTPFSWRMLVGRMVKVKVSHELYNGDIQERVAGVTAP